MKKKILILMTVMTMTFTAVACSGQGDYYEGFVSDQDEGKGDKIPSGGQYVRKTKTYIAMVTTFKSLNF